MNIDLIALITRIVVFAIGSIITYFYSKDARFRHIVELIDKGVRAAEQMQEAGLLKIPKKDYVIKFVREKGIKISDEYLETILESLVWDLNIEKKIKKGDV